MAIITLADARTHTPDVYTGEIIDEARHDILLDSMLFDDNTQFRGRSFYYGYSRIIAHAAASNRTLGNEFAATQTRTELKTAVLSPSGLLVQMDRTEIEALQATVTGVTEFDFQMTNALNSTKMLFSDNFINADSAGAVIAYDGIDKICTANGRVFDPGASTPTDVTNAANDNTFLFKLDTILADVRSQGPGQRYIAYNYKLYPVFKRILRNSNLLLTDVNQFGTEIMKYGDAIFIPMGEKSGDAGDIIPIGTGASAGLTSLYAFKIGQEAVHAVTAFPEIIRPRLPIISNMVDSVQKVGVEMLMAFVVKNYKAVYKYANIKIA